MGAVLSGWELLGNSMNVHLTPELEELVQSKVKSGRYSSAIEVVRVALRLLEEHDNGRALCLNELHTRIDDGLAALDRGEGVDGEKFMQEILDGLDSQAKHKTG
jgi:antitoxin ParD1/3/4